MATRIERHKGDSGSNGGTSKAASDRNGASSNGHGSAANGNGNGNGNGGVAAAEARRIATEMGSAMLVASSMETARHSDDVELIASAICEHLGMPSAEQADVRAGARLHDIGKAALPPELLEKPTDLTFDEWELMRTHTIIGEQILSSVRELKGIARLVRHSHERWDGTGYPDGLAGDEIPLGSRIIFCADAFHAIRADRAYREGVPAPRAMREIHRCAGSQFDPEIVDAFEHVVRELRLVPAAAKRASKRSSRLSALLLCLALGGGASAVGQSDLLGDPDESADPQAPSVVRDCGRLYCYSPTGLSALSAFGGGFGEPSALDRPGGPQGAHKPGAGETGPSLRPGFGGVTGPIAGSRRPAGGNGGGAQGDAGDAGGPGDPPASSPTSKDKNPDANGNGWAKGHAKNGVPKGPPESAGNGGGNGGSNSGGGSKTTSSATATSGPGNSGNAPGHN